ncbi:MAG: class I SAM-dependent methyltransferase [Gammaproteobacteria bacterium]|nr:class I SAM-dependent methyltransferase [Gammaproteobacteria bacterium]
MEKVSVIDDSETTKLNKVDQYIRKKVLQQLSGIKSGQLIIHDGIETLELGEKKNNDLTINVWVKKFSFYTQIATHGSIGAAESYMADEWHTDNLTSLVQLLVRNRDLLDDMEGGTAWIKNAILKFWHRLNKNNQQGSRKNIAAHYDLGNEFFSLFLDKHLMYSSAIYTEEANTLEQASELKLRTICEKLQLTSNDHLIEIGTGWGGLAIYAAQNYGCKVTTTTISEQQYQFAAKRVEALSLNEKITLLKEDYRNLTGQYDKLVSIEMIEAVGHHYLDTYISKCNRLLKDDGLALIQAITIEDHRYDQALSSVDFIKRYIFPGSFIPSVSTIVNSMKATGDFRLINLEDFGESYAKTLHDWRRAFLDNLDSVREQGFSESFIKMWEFYLCYCEGGFMEKAISDVHLLIAKPSNKRSQWLSLQH